jgi:hypothetical protein
MQEGFYPLPWIRYSSGMINEKFQDVRRSFPTPAGPSNRQAVSPGM